MSVNAARDVAGRLREIRALAESDAPMAACDALGDIAQTTIRAVLTAREHPKATRTPSPKGTPPAKVSGDLAKSMLKTPAVLVTAGCAHCQVGSALVYASVHQFGPVTIKAKNFPQLGNPEVGFFGRQVVIPGRPYFEAAVLLLAAGPARDACERAWQAVIDI